MRGFGSLAAVPPLPEASAGPVGRCAKCGAVVKLIDAFQRGDSDGAFAHRIGTTSKDPVGEVCGPVVKGMAYHVIAECGPIKMRMKMVSTHSPEESYDEVVSGWERAISSMIQARDQKGAVLIGADKPNVCITNWKPLGLVPLDPPQIAQA